MQLASRKLFFESLINPLLALDAILANKFATHDDGLKMLAVAVQFEIVAGHAGQDELFDMFGVHRDLRL